MKIVFYWYKTFNEQLTENWDPLQCCVLSKYLTQNSVKKSKYKLEHDIILVLLNRTINLVQNCSFCILDHVILDPIV